jgi:hypothetical protein
MPGLAWPSPRSPLPAPRCAVRGARCAVRGWSTRRTRPTASACSSRPTASPACSSRPTASPACSSRPTASPACSSRPTASPACSSRRWPGSGKQKTRRAAGFAGIRGQGYRGAPISRRAYSSARASVTKFRISQQCCRNHHPGTRPGTREGHGRPSQSSRRPDPGPRLGVRRHAWGAPNSGSRCIRCRTHSLANRTSCARQISCARLQGAGSDHSRSSAARSSRTASTRGLSASRMTEPHEYELLSSVHFRSSASFAFIPPRIGFRGLRAATREAPSLACVTHRLDLVNAGHDLRPARACSVLSHLSIPYRSAQALGPGPRPYNRGTRIVPENDKGPDRGPRG